MSKSPVELVSHVRSLRKALGITQVQLAELVEVSRQTIAEIERGNYNPSTALALRIGVVLTKRVEELFELTSAEAAVLSQKAVRIFEGHIDKGEEEVRGIGT